MRQVTHLPPTLLRDLIKSDVMHMNGTCRTPTTHSFAGAVCTTATIISIAIRRIRHVTRMNESRDIHEKVKSRVTHMNWTCHAPTTHSLVRGLRSCMHSEICFPPLVRGLRSPLVRGLRSCIHSTLHHLNHRRNMLYVAHVKQLRATP